MSQSATSDDLFPFIFMFKKEARKCLKVQNLMICSHLFLCSKKEARKCLKVRHLMICSPHHSFLNYGNLFHCKWDVNSFSCCLRTDIAVASCRRRADISLVWTKTSHFCSKFGNKINCFYSHFMFDVFHEELFLYVYFSYGAR